MTKWSDEHLAMAVELVITQGKSNAIAAGLITRATGIHRTKDSVIGILNRKVRELLVDILEGDKGLIDAIGER